MEVIYYTDELNDDFSRLKTKKKSLPNDYKYFSKNLPKKFFDFVLYRGIATPVAYVYDKVVFQEKIINKKVLEPYMKDGFFLYGNHTRMAGDAFCPSRLTFPKKAYIITNPDSVTIPVVGNITAGLGAVPLPTSIKGLHNFHKCILTHSKKNHIIVIYPEAHIWPYYTDIRPFKENSFIYPAETNKPMFTFTVTYQDRKFFKHPKVVVYVDGPFFPKKDLSVKENQTYLRDLAYQTMKKRSMSSTIQFIRYEKKGNNQ